MSDIPGGKKKNLYLKGFECNLNGVKTTNISLNTRTEQCDLFRSSRRLRVAFLFTFRVVSRISH